MKKPNFIIPGAGRSGTTTLCNYLKQHPDIYVLWNKEPNYFSFEYQRGDEWYLRLFHNTRSDSYLKDVLRKKLLGIFMDLYDGEQFLGEASTYYFIHPKVPERMYDFNPDFRLIFILRNPIERAFSNYKRDIQMRGESRSFKHIICKAVCNSEDSLYLTYGKYYMHILRFMKYFDLNQMHFILFDNFKSNPGKELASVLEFLGLDSNFTFNHNTVSKNPSCMPLSFRLQKLNYRYFSSNFRDNFLKRAFKFIFRQSINFFNHPFEIRRTPVMDESTREFLRDYYRDDISKLEGLLDKDLSHWK